MNRSALKTSIGLSLLFLIVYGGTNYLTSLRSDVGTWVYEWEKWIPFVPDVPGLTLLLAHAADVGDAYRRAVLSDARGAFNIAGEPVLDAAAIADALETRTLRLPVSALRGAARATWLARLQPTSPDWIDLALGAPVLDTARARSELGWAPTRNAVDTLREVVAGMREHAGRETPPLESSRKR